MSTLPWTIPNVVDDDLVRVVVSDVHGDIKHLRLLLRHLNIIDEHDVRQPGFHTVQLGDFIHCGHQSWADDRELLRLQEKYGWFDVILLGNHEARPVYDMRCGDFSGRHQPFVETTDSIKRLKELGFSSLHTLLTVGYSPTLVCPGNTVTSPS